MRVSCGAPSVSGYKHLFVMLTAVFIVHCPFGVREGELWSTDATRIKGTLCIKDNHPFLFLFCEVIIQKLFCEERMKRKSTFPMDNSEFSNWTFKGIGTVQIIRENILLLHTWWKDHAKGRNLYSWSLPLSHVTCRRVGQHNLVAGFLLPQ